MLLLQDGVLAFLSAVGLTSLVWILGGALFRIGGRPAVPGLLLVLPLKGEALAMEADVRELRRIQGGLPGAKIILADCGLTPGPVSGGPGEKRRPDSRGGTVRGTLTPPGREKRGCLKWKS